MANDQLGAPQGAPNPFSPENPKGAHYYGDIVRQLFLAAAVLMILALPFFSDKLPAGFFMILAIVVIALAAGITSPSSRWIFVVNTAIAIIGLLFFESNAVYLYRTNLGTNLLFWGDQVLAIIFLLALYNSTKTLRAMLLEI